MYHVSVQGVDERIINVHYHYIIMCMCVCVCVCVLLSLLVRMGIYL